MDLRADISPRVPLEFSKGAGRRLSLVGKKFFLRDKNLYIIPVNRFLFSSLWEIKTYTNGAKF